MKARLFIPGILAAFALFSCSSTDTTATKTSLKDSYRQNFLIGAALNRNQIYGTDEAEVELIKTEFNSITPENVFKPGPIHPEPQVYKFEPADKFVEFGEKNNMFMVGHTLVWHSQVADWMFIDDERNLVGRDSLIKRMDDHIRTIVGRYKGRVQGWDVVNEALNDDGTLRQTKWLNIIGEEYIERAFLIANETDPQAELYYNDYNLWKPEKRDGAVRLVKDLQEKGIRVDGIGMQGHYGIGYPSIEQIEQSILAFSDLGVKVMITELDIDILPNPSKRQGADIGDAIDFQEGYNPYAHAQGLPDSVQQKLASRYAELFALFHKHQDKIDRVTFWGVADHHSWLNNWPMPGRTSYPLVFDRDLKPKPAYNAIVKVASENK